MRPARAIAAAAVATACSLSAATAPDEAARLMNELMLGKSPVGGPFALTDSDGRKRGLADFRGKRVLLYFGYTFCPDVCPTDLAQIAGAMRLMGAAADDIQPILITLDPARDSAPLLREYAAAFHPRLMALRGSEEQVRRVARSFKVYYRRRGDFIDHTAYTFLLDRNGRYVAFLPPGTRAERIVEFVRELDR